MREFATCPEGRHHGYREAYEMGPCSRCAHEDRTALAQGAIFDALKPGDTVRVNAYGRDVLAFVARKNRVTLVVDGLRPAQNNERHRIVRDGLVIDTSIASSLKVRTRDIILPKAESTP